MKDVFDLSFATNSGFTKSYLNSLNESAFITIKYLEMLFQILGFGIYRLRKTRHWFFVSVDFVA